MCQVCRRAWDKGMCSIGVKTVSQLWGCPCCWGSEVSGMREIEIARVRVEQKVSYAESVKRV